jgi:K+-transporting ATPase ATPase C chain
MGREMLTAIRVSAVTLLLTGIAYPLAITTLAQVGFPRRANGSLVADAQGRVVGSELIAQPFRGDRYFHPRPSAAGAGYDGMSSGGSNLGPTSRALRERVSSEIDRLRAENPDASGPVPADLVTTSASGLDPDISPEAAIWQIPRIARARGASPERVRAIVDARTTSRDLGFLGERRVNVLLLNLALDRELR